VVGALAVLGAIATLAIVKPWARGAGASATQPHTATATASETKAPEAKPIATAATETATATAPAVAAQVAIVLKGAPANAEVFQGDVKLGIATQPLKLARSTQKTTLTVKALGYRPATVEIVPDADREVPVMLTKFAAATSATAKAAGPAAGGGNKDLENPF
jgi:hypothetical protein